VVNHRDLPLGLIPRVLEWEGEQVEGEDLTDAGLRGRQGRRHGGRAVGACDRVWADTPERPVKADVSRGQMSVDDPKSDVQAEPVVRREAMIKK
jgi:hypothetical protein